MDNNIYKQHGSELFTVGSHSTKSIDKNYKIVMYILIIGKVYYLLKFSAEVYFTDDNIYTGFISFFDIFRPVLFAVDLLGLYWLIKY